MFFVVGLFGAIFDAMKEITPPPSTTTMNKDMPAKSFACASKTAWATLA